MATVLDSIKRYQHIIDKHSHDEHKILKCINKLYHMDVTVQHLQETGVGRTINSLRKESGDVGPAARSLVQKWKEMVAAEESDEDGYQSHETTTYNGHGSGRESDDNGRHDGRSSTINASKMNGNHSGTKREYHSSEDEGSNEKRSKNSYDEYHRESSKTRKEENNKPKRSEPTKVSRKDAEYESHDSEASDSDESDTSDSSVDHSKTKRPDKKESLTDHRSSKHSSQNNLHSENKDSSSKKLYHKEKHSEYHSSSSKDRHSSEKSQGKDKEKSHKDKESSRKHKSLDDKIVIPEKKPKPDHKSIDHKINNKESKPSSKHSKIEEHRPNKLDSNEKQKYSSEKHNSKPDKHRSSSQSQDTDKQKHKQSEAEGTKHKSKDNHSSSSKEKSSSSSREKLKDKNNSSKDKPSSHKHESDSKTSSSEHKSKSEKHESRSSEKKSKHKSSTSSDHKPEKSSSKTQEKPKKKDNENHGDSDDGIDSGSGASFAEALGMISPAKPKKKLPQIKDLQSPNSSFSNDMSPANLLAPTAKLAPLPPLEITALPEISPNYRPRPPPKALLHFTDDEALNAGISSKNQRTKVYSGNKVMGKIPSLYDMCVHILQEHIDALEFTGGVPYNILKPVVDRATPQQLFTLEHYNPYLMEDTDHLWQKFCEKSFRNKQRREMETWREMFLRCQEEQEHKLKALTANIKITQEAKKAPIRQTKMAYVDTVVKPPRNIARKQALHGTAHTSAASPAARVASLASAPNVARVGAVRPPPPTISSSSSANKPKKAPLMLKTLQFMRGRKR